MLRTNHILGIFLAVHAAAHAQDAATDFKSHVMPVLKARCVECHSGKEAEAKLDLSQPRSLAQLQSETRQWFRVLDRIEDGSMPPADAEPLKDAERKVIANWVRQPLTAHLKSVQQQEGRSKLRRLSRSEYANTIYDLFGIRPPVKRDLPNDGRVDGYEKVSAALPLSSASAAGYMKITADLLGRAFAYAPQPERTVRLWAGPSEQSAGHILELPDGTKVSFNTDFTSGPLRLKSPTGELTGSWSARVPGWHKLRISVYGYQTDKPLAFGIYAGHIWAYPQLIDLVKVLEASPGQPTILETQIYLRTTADNDLAQVSDGFRLVPFGIGVQVPKNTQASDCKGPGLAVQWVEVEEPELPVAGDRWLTANMQPEFATAFLQPGATLESSKLPRDEVMSKVEQSLRRIAARLFRRDLAADEAASIMASFTSRIDSGTPLSNAYLEEVSSLLTSPDFLCVIEQSGPLNDFALASRLSLFLWNAAPDEELLEVARQGKLHEADVLRQQTERLLNDARSQRFVDDFLDQWLGLWGIDNTKPDGDLYPEFDDELKLSSVMETQATFRRMLDKNLSVREFVAPTQMLVNKRLAKHYGLPDVQGFALQAMAIPADSPYGGIWTQASIMKVTANGTLTSPVKRGVWMAERLLGTPIPPPPPNIEPVNPDTRGAKTLREQLALHSGKGSCQSCHAKFDPYGFALESFDVMGNFRTSYRKIDPEFAKLAPEAQKGRNRWCDGLPVDCEGKTLDGTAFADIKDLRKQMAERPEQLARGVTRHLLTYATATPATRLDQDTIDGIVKKAANSDYGLRSLVHEVVQSKLFQSK